MQLQACLCDTLIYLKTIQEEVNAFRRLADEQTATILKNECSHKCFQIILSIAIKIFEHNIVTIFGKFLLLKKFALIIVTSTVISNTAIGAICFMKDICANKIRKLMIINLYRKAAFQIYCGHWFWAVEKKVGMIEEHALFV